MKSNLAIIAILLAATACRQNAHTAAELEAKPQAVETEPCQVGKTQTEQPAAAPLDAGFGADFYIEGKNVTMRASNSAQSAKIGTFEQWEPVTVLQMKTAQNTTEAVLREPVSLSTASGERIKVPAGRAVRLGKFNAGMDDCQVEYADTYEVTFDHPIKGTLSGDISTDLLDSDNLWYRVERANGTRGWVFGKFVVEGPLVGEECAL